MTYLSINFSNNEVKARYENVPGLHDKKFTIKLKATHFEKGEIVVPARTELVAQITKVYPRTWLRNLRTRLGLKTKLFEVKLIQKI